MTTGLRKVLLVTGGARSGKSRYAERRALGMGPRLLYVATAEPLDSEMARRIEEHRSRRAGLWQTLEEPLEVRRALELCHDRVDCALVDCVTLWLSNLVLRRGEAAVEGEVEALLDLIRRTRFSLVFVTNEVGSGIVPDNPLARQFRDIAGKTNQRIAELADEVILMVAGIPVRIKPWSQPCA